MSSPRMARVMVGGTGLLLVAAWLAAFLEVSAPAGRKGPGSTEESFSLSEKPPEDTAAALSRIKAAELWGSAASLGAAPVSPADGPALTPPDWRVAGVAGSPGEERVLLLNAGVPVPTVLRVGEKLPGGAVIEAVREGEIIVKLQGRRAALSTYPR